MDKCDMLLAKLLAEFLRTGVVPFFENDHNGYVNGQLEARCEYILGTFFKLEWEAIKNIVYNRTSRFDFETLKEEKLCHDSN